MAGAALSNIYTVISQYKPVLVGTQHEKIAIDVLLTTSVVAYLPSLQYTTAVRVFGFLVITVVTRTSAYSCAQQLYAPSR